MAVDVSELPLNVGCDTDPAGVYVPVLLIELPVNVAFSTAPVPVKLGCDTDPAGVNDPLLVSELPLNDALSTVPVPVNVGCVVTALCMPVTTVVLLPLVGRVP